MSEPSQSEANKMLRVLAGNSPRLKFTVRVHIPDGKVVEFQSDSKPQIAWHAEARGLWVFCGVTESYDTVAVMQWPVGGILLIEINEKASS